LIMKERKGREKAGFFNIHLKDALFLGFCAVFILIFRAAFRLHLNITGHSMLFSIFFLLLARGCISFRLAASLTGLLAGCMAIILGLGKGGPLLLLRFVLPGLIIDMGAFCIPSMFRSYVLCALAGAVASSSKFLSTYIVDTMIGMEKSIIFQHALIESGAAILFGIAGSFFIPPVIRRLKAYGVIDY